MNTIISKRESPFIYCAYKKVNGQFFQDGPSILINGGAGIVGGLELLSGRPLDRRNSVIPVGVHTYVDDTMLDKLMTIGKFRHDIKRGMIVVVKGKKLDQGKTDTIAEKDMIEDDHIPTRPVSEEEIEAAGAKINKDGSVDIGDLEGDNSPLAQRKSDAGQPAYVKKRNQENRKQKNAERKTANRRRR